MAIIIFEGWKVGMRKIPFIHLLNLKVGFSLKESKKMKDLIVDGEKVKINVESMDFANEIVKEATELGVICRATEDQ